MAERWPTVPLGEVASVIRGVSFDKGDASNAPADGLLPILRAGNIADGLDLQNDLIWVSERRVSAEQRLRKHDVAIAMSSGSRDVVGKTAQLHQPWNGSVGAFCAIVRFGPKLHPHFGAHWLRSSQFTEWRWSQAQGANIQNLRKSDLAAISVPVPPLTEQERIVGILDEADALRQRRAQADRRTAEFIPALFHEMFGDHSRKWKFVGLGELVRFVGGGTPSRACPEFFEGTIPWATSKDVKSDYMSDTQEHITEDAIEKSATNLVPARSVLVVVKSKILMHSLPIAITTAPMCFGQDLKALICGEKTMPEFIVASLSSQRQSILAKARGANTEGLTLEILRSVSIPLPPVSLQREFAERVGEVRALETAQAQSRQRLDALFASLLDRAFKGEL